MNPARCSLHEFIIVLVGGLVLAFTANALSPRGISLTHDFFPAPPTTPPAPLAEANPSSLIAPTPKHEFPSVTLDEVQAFYSHSNYTTRSFLLIDARDDASYRKGHIPGALQFDRYRPAAYIPTVLPAARSAAKVVIYCHGGDCEDSVQAARLLIELGVNRHAIHIFDAGIESWKAAKLPIQSKN